MGLFAKRQSVALRIEGMTCGHCEQKVVTALTNVKGVHLAKIDRPAGRGTVEVDVGTDLSALTAAVAKVGYRASIETTSA